MQHKPYKFHDYTRTYILPDLATIKNTEWLIVRQS